MWRCIPFQAYSALQIQIFGLILGLILSVFSVWHQILIVISKLHVFSLEALGIAKKVENVMTKYFSYWVLNFLSKAVGIKVAW